MKKLFLILAAALLLASCGSKPQDTLISKDKVEFGGNAFTSFALGSDVKFFLTPNAENASKFAIQASVPVRKEVSGTIPGLDIELIPTDDRGLKVRDGFVLKGEDIDNMLPVFNAGERVEKTVVFAVEENGKKDFTSKEAAELLKKITGVTMNFNIKDGEVTPTAVEEKKEEKPIDLNTVDGLCRKFGVYGLLGSYDYALRHGNKKQAKNIESRLWSIEKQVKGDKSIPEWLRDAFQDYIENREDQIEDKY